MGRILSHTVCNACGLGFNSKTGSSNQGAITIYMLVAVGVAVLMLLLLFGVMR